MRQAQWDPAHAVDPDSSSALDDFLHELVGYCGDDLVLIDEVLTPDSSRFWPRATYAPGGTQKSYDKQYLRDYLVSINWDKQPPAPALPESVVRDTRRKYLEALDQLTGVRHAF